MGGVVSKEVWAKGASKIVKDQLAEAFSHYPTDWASIAEKSVKKIVANKEDRGFFARVALTGQGNLKKSVSGQLSDYLTITMNGVRKSTPYHEIGHMVEWNNPDIVRLEKAWIDSRTAGDREERLRDLFPMFGYDGTEVVKKDDFVTPYIGKYYSDAAEVLSVGLQGIYTPDELFTKSYNKQTKAFERVKITDDEDFLHLVIGLLLKG